MTLESCNLSLNVLILDAHNLIISPQVILLLPGHLQLVIDIPQIGLPLKSNARLVSVSHLFSLLSVHKISLLDQFLVKAPLE